MDFAPDLDPITPGVILDAGNLYPSAKAWRSYPSLSQVSASVLPSKALGAFTAQLAGAIAIVAGTANDLHLFVNNAWVAQGLASTSTTRWRFDQYGGLIIATNGVDAPYSYNGVGTFAPLGGSPPVASIVQASNYALFLIEANSSIWHASLSATIWTNSIATQTVSDAIDETPGYITAAHRLRAGMTIFKNKAIHYGQFVGPPLYWDFQMVSSSIGAPSQEAIANLGEVLMWPGNDDFYSFDGYSLNRIPNQLKEWFFETVDGAQMDKISARWDQKRSLVFWHFPSRQANPTGSLDSWICLNIRTGKWGYSKPAYTEKIDVPIFSALQTGELTYDALTTERPTYGDFDGAIYGDIESQSVEVSGAICASDQTLCLYNGVPDQAMVTTHDFGDYYNLFQVTRVKPHFTIYPDGGASLTVLNQRNEGRTPIMGVSQTLSTDGFFNFRNTARIQRFKIQMESDAEIMGMDALIEYSGEQ